MNDFFRKSDGWPLALGVLVVGALMACQGKSPGPEPIAEYTFSGLVGGETVDIDLEPDWAGPLLLRVEAFETAFESTVIGEDGEALSVARLPDIREGPVFHVLRHGAESEPRRVVIQVEELTRKARISARVFKLPTETSGDDTRIEAYRAFEAATQSTDNESPELWRERAALLHSAAGGFERAGEVEAQLWAEFLEAYVHYFPLANYREAVQKAKAVRKRARDGDIHVIELMAAQLQGQLLIERDERDSPEQARDKGERAQIVLQFAADLAAQMGYRYEQAWALNSRGIGYFYQDRFALAGRKFQKALDIAFEMEDGSFQNQLRGNLALVHERQGDLFGALAELQEINAQLQQAGDAADLAHNWSDLGRLYRRLYLFPESIEALSQALELWQVLNSAEGRGRSGRSLAYAYHAIGKPERAIPILVEAIADMEKAGHARGLRDGFALLADIYRRQGKFYQMAEARKRQSEFLTSDLHKAKYRYAMGLDVLAQSPDESSLADLYFAQAEMSARDAGDRGLELRARLQRCALALDSTKACASPELPAAVEEWLPSAPPSQAFEVRYLLARHQDKLGRTAEAWALLDQLVDDLQVYRDNLPGVLGAWYWEGRGRIFHFYMALALREVGDASDRATRSLLAFNRLLNTSLGRRAPTAPSDEEAKSGELAELRSLLARLDDGHPEDAGETRRAIDRRLLQLQSEVRRQAGVFDAQALQSALGQLPFGSGVLAYYLTPDEAWAWQGSAQGLRLVALGPGKAIEEALERVRSGLRVFGNTGLDRDLERAGDLLFGPVVQDLPENVYLLAAGPLSGFPLEALKTGGRYFGQDHAVINLLSLEALRAAPLPASAKSWQAVLLAGDPLRPDDNLSELPAASRELDGLAELMGGRSITNARGEGLGLALFSEPAFADADLIHIASHAEINLEYPELSQLIMSAEGGEWAFLTPLDLGGRTIAAELVVLSACETTGVNAYSFDSNLGFVSAFLNAGAGAVVATLWPVPDAYSAEFMPAFYAAMLDGANAPSALAQVKRRFMADSPAGGIPDWPAFQVYVN